MCAKVLESADFSILERALMIPGTGARARAPFPYVGLAAIVLLVHAILVAVVPLNPYRAAFAFAALFAVGYCTLALIVGDTIRLTAPEILALSTGLAIFITSLSALGVSVLGIPITVFAVVIVGLPIAILAWFARHSSGGSLTAITTFGRGLFDFSDYSGSEKGIVAGLLAAITAALVVLVSLSLVHYPDRLSPALGVTASDGTTDHLPTDFPHGQPQLFNVSVLGGSTPGAFTVRIALIPRNATGNETFHTVPQTSPLHMDAFAEYRVSIVLGSGEAWEQQFSISVEPAPPPPPGVPFYFYLRFELLDGAGAVVAANSVPLRVT
jgi:hypothetical protein